MSDEPTRNPRPIQPNTDTELSELLVGQPQRTLVEELGDVADDLRQLNTDFGLRPYTVHAVRIRWTGGEVGRGNAITVLDDPLLPTPLVRGISSVERTSKNAGAVERGDIRLEEVSPRYTEDQIKRYFAQDLRRDEEGYIEIRMDSRDGETERKRYVVARVPERRPDKFDWIVTLRKQDKNRPRRLV